MDTKSITSLEKSPVNQRLILKIDDEEHKVVIKEKRYYKNGAEVDEMEIGRYGLDENVDEIRIEVNRIPNKFGKVRQFKTRQTGYGEYTPTIKINYNKGEMKFCYGEEYEIDGLRLI